MKKIGYIIFDFLDDVKKVFQKYVKDNVLNEELFYIEDDDNKKKGGIVVDKLHLTLVFGIDNEFYKEEYINNNSIKDIVLGELDLFYIPDYQCNALVVKVKDDGKKITKLHNDLMDKLIFIKKNKFDFVPHITIAYVKKNFKIRNKNFFLNKKIKIKSIKYKIKS